MLQGLDRESGLLGLTGTKDMREVLAREAAGDPDAVLGLGTYLHRLVGSVAAMAASLGGLDALVFTGGVGENARRLVVERMSWPAMLARLPDILAGAGERRRDAA